MGESNNKWRQENKREENNKITNEEVSLALRLPVVRGMIIFYLSVWEADKGTKEVQINSIGQDNTVIKAPFKKESSRYAKKKLI